MACAFLAVLPFACRYHARVEEEETYFSACVDTHVTFETVGLRVELTVGDPFQESGMVSLCIIVY